MAAYYLIEAHGKLIITEAMPTTIEDNGGYSHAVFTEEEWEAGGDFGYEEMKFDSIENAREWVSCDERSN